MESPVPFSVETCSTGSIGKSIRKYLRTARVQLIHFLEAGERLLTAVPNFGQSTTHSANPALDQKAPQKLLRQKNNGFKIIHLQNRKLQTLPIKIPAPVERCKIVDNCL